MATARRRKPANIVHGLSVRVAMATYAETISVFSTNVALLLTIPGMFSLLTVRRIVDSTEFFPLNWAIAMLNGKSKCRASDSGRPGAAPDSSHC